MLPPLFYAPPEQVAQDHITLPKDEAHHAHAVMRLARGAAVVVIDGLGTAHRGAITSISKQSVTVEILGTVRNFGEPMVKLTLAAGMSAGGKLDQIVQQGTELGVSRFVPIISEKSKVRLDDDRRARNRVRRLERVALAATKQCRRSYRPDIAAPVGLADFLTNVDDESLKMVFHPDQKAGRLADIVADGDVKRVTALVGPESGFSDNEMELARAAGFSPVTLGERVLRAETAGPVVCALVMNHLGEFK